MKGHNEIHINQATMMEAIQLWLDHQFKEPPEVMLVSKNNNPPHSGSDQFIIKVNQPDAARTDGGDNA